MQHHRSFLFVSLLASLALAACGGDSTAEDGGIHIDLGMASDAGPDAGAVDLGTDAGGGVDMGLTGMCAQMLAPLPAMYLPRCAAATAACADGATSSAALQACFTSDTTAPVTVSGQTLNCGTCVNYMEFACFDANGCHDAVAGLNCCATAMCGAAPTPACAMSMCAAQYSALQTCATTTGASCLRSTGQYVSDCYGGSTPTDGGTPDAGTSSDAGAAPDA